MAVNTHHPSVVYVQAKKKHDKQQGKREQWTARPFENNLMDFDSIQALEWTKMKNWINYKTNKTMHLQLVVGSQYSDNI